MGHGTEDPRGDDWMEVESEVSAFPSGEGRMPTLEFLLDRYGRRRVAQKKVQLVMYVGRLEAVRR